MDLNNRRTGEHATKPRALGLLGHSVLMFTLFRFKGPCNARALTDPGYLNSVTLET